MSFALGALGGETAWATLGDGVDLFTEDGIAMELHAFAMTIFNSGASDKTIVDLVDSVRAITNTPSNRSLRGVMAVFVIMVALVITTVALHRLFN